MIVKTYRVKLAMDWLRKIAQPMMKKLILANFRGKVITVTTRTGEELFPAVLTAVNTEVHPEGLFYVLMLESVEHEPFTRIAHVYYGNVKWINNRWEAKSSKARKSSSLQASTSKTGTFWQSQMAPSSMTADGRKSRSKSSE